ncbi:hypothetical protein B0T26DRAFT_615700, partial [Lasiosphaeria miniovina]
SSKTPLNNDVTKSCEEAVRLVTKKCGMTYAVIRKGPHDKMCQYDQDGRRQTVAFNSGAVKPTLKQSDWHVTISMGKTLNECYVQGHVFVVNKGGDVKWSLMDDPATQRFYKGDGAEAEAIELWLM